jgi:hypothetical protein
MWAAVSLSHHNTFPDNFLSAQYRGTASIGALAIFLQEVF